jgi:hypothetical protein
MRIGCDTVEFVGRKCNRPVIFAFSRLQIRLVRQLRAASAMLSMSL